MVVHDGVASWVKVCDAGDLAIGIGVSALVRGKQIALFKTSARRVHAIGNRDPYSGRHNMSRGLLVHRAGSTLLAAPAGKELFDLESGRRLGDPAARLATYPVRVVNGYVEVCVTIRG